MDERGVAKVPVSLRDVLATGRFGPVHLEMLDRDVANHFGPPEVVGVGAVRVEDASIWKYGDFEFHFVEDRRLFLVFTETFGRFPRGGATVEFDPWFLKRTLTISEAEKSLSAANIRFNRMQPKFKGDTHRLVVGRTVRFSFIVENDEDGREPGLASLSLTDLPL